MRHVLDDCNIRSFNDGFTATITGWGTITTASSLIWIRVTEMLHQFPYIGTSVGTSDQRAVGLIICLR